MHTSLRNREPVEEQALDLRSVSASDLAWRQHLGSERAKRRHDFFFLRWKDGMKTTLSNTSRSERARPTNYLTISTGVSAAMATW